MKQHYFAVYAISVLWCLLLTGCTARQISREFDNVFGGLAREHVENLGSPGRGHSLMKQRFSNEYVVVSEPNWILRLGEEFAGVRVVQQFIYGNKDYAILACTRADGTLYNALLVMTATPSETVVYNLNSDSDKPFFTDATKKSTRLIQEMDSPETVRVWWLGNDLRVPTIVPVAELQPSKEKLTRKSKGRASSTSPKAPTVSVPSMPLPPPVNPTATVRMEEADTTPQQAPKPEEAKSGQTKPVIILDPQPTQTVEPPKPTSSEKLAPSRTEAPAPVIIIQ